MKNKLNLILILTIFLSSCEFKVNSNDSNTAKLGMMPEVKAQTFKNIYIADEKNSESKGLPVTRFAIEYPDGLDIEFPNDQKNHIIIKKKVGNIVTEALTIGNSTVNLKNTNLALGLIENITDNLKKQLPGLEVISIGKKEFDGEMNYMFEGKVDYSDFEAQGFKGVYKVLFILPLPKENEDLNAVIISFIANEQSEIQTFSDFSSSGMIGKVYQTFRYIE